MTTTQAMWTFALCLCFVGFGILASRWANQDKLLDAAMAVLFCAFFLWCILFL